MTDNDIIKALRECEDCHYFNECEKSTRLALDLINRQKAEIERLELEIENLESVQEISPEAKYLVDAKADKVISLLTEVTKSQDQIKAEAIKEFVERLYKYGAYVTADEIEQTEKEMVGDV